MGKHTKVIMAGLIGLVTGYLLGMIAGVAKLISLGGATWTGSARVFDLPVMHIESHNDGFVIQTEWGVFALAVIGAALAVAFAVTRKPRASKAN